MRGFLKPFQNPHILFPAEWYSKLSSCTNSSGWFSAAYVLFWTQITLSGEKNPVTTTKWPAWKTEQTEAKWIGWLWRAGQGWKEVIVNSGHTAGEQEEQQKRASGFELISSPNSKSSVGPFVDVEFLLVSKAAVPPLPLSLPVWCTACRKTV